MFAIDRHSALSRKAEPNLLFLEGIRLSGIIAFFRDSASGFESGTISQALRTGRVTVYTVQTSGQRWKPHEAKKIERKN